MNMYLSIGLGVFIGNGAVKIATAQVKLPWVKWLVKTYVKFIIDELD